MTGLSESKLFSSLSAADLEKVAQCCVERRFEPGEVVFKEGDAGDGIYLLREGVIQISALVGQGQGQERRVLSRIRPGEFFGEMAVLDNEPRSATALAESAAAAYFIPREKLVLLLQNSPGLAVNLVREFSLRMRDFNRQYIQEVLQAERLTLVGRFARSIVHDFKNPLNIIGLAAELASAEPSSSEMRQMATTRIRKQVDRLTNMINELIEFTRGPQGPVVLSSSNYGDYVKQIVGDLETEMRDKQITLVYRHAPPSVELPFDPKRLLHVFSNLIHNAADAMPEGGTVYLDFRTTPTEIVTEIEDTGRGIAPEIQPRLFEAFATFGKAKGTGLGLSICRKIIEDHQGWITARNESGSGAVFSFALPLTAG